ncbi:hypothetical protein RCV-Z_ORF12 [Rana catesbeiana virus]|uniref:Uncharacterized protein n=2 Tax=Frog virus 3 TaxID=10493 RepID=A0A2U7M3H3_FRG3V|nr:hypothetical protein [Chinese giant salamander iridovirus]API65207.1 hypothetical protein FV3_ORF10.5 [Frog virus 3]API65318.1 hypothetical protein RCV-Z_ORF11 [Rana catesbeiana virus]ASU44138.1 hypothetical protein RCV-Z2_ORF10 [Rana catesbeiana virus 2]ASU44241.1 hypothetical protein RCV-Z_ORF12 [Rana catesbeiana virus]
MCVSVCRLADGNSVCVFRIQELPPVLWVPLDPCLPLRPWDPLDPSPLGPGGPAGPSAPERISSERKTLKTLS